MNYKDILSWLSAFIFATITATLTIDSRYAHSDEINKYKSDMRQWLLAQQRVMEKNIVGARIQALDDQIFALRLKASDKKLDRVDDAMLSRYLEQRETLQKSLQYTETPHAFGE